MTGARNVGLYFACQALVASSTSLMVAASAIVGASLAPDARLATLPAAAQQLGTFLITYPASQLMARRGRRAGFSLGAALGVLGGGVATLAVLGGSFAGFCVGTALIGGHAGFATFYRFAAAESVPVERRERALGWVMSAGVLAALIGPWLANHTKDLGTPFAASFAALLGMALAALIALQFVAPPADAPTARPDASQAAAASTAAAVATVRSGGALRRVTRRPAFLGVTSAAMVSGASMVFVMTATPLAMAGCHHGFGDTSSVIQWHIIAMFAPSFVTGRLAARVGPFAVIRAGLALCAAAALINVSGTSVLHFQAGLIALGLGWNLAFIGVSATLARTAPEDRAAAQGLNDALVFSAVAVASLLSGVVEHGAGWRALNLGVLPFVAAAMLIGLRRRVVVAA